MLEENLKVLDRVMPYASERVRAILEKVGPNVPFYPTECPIKPPDSSTLQSIPKVLLILGIGDPRYLNAIFEDPYMKENNQLYIIVENDATAIAQFFTYVNANEMLQKQQIKWLLGNSLQEAHAAFFKILKQNFYSCIMENCVALTNEITNPALHDFYQKITAVYQEATSHVYHNYGRIDDSLEGVRASFDAIDKLEQCPGIEDLRNSCKGKKAIIVGAGPSLDDAIPYLKEHQNNLTIICVDAATKVLVDNGIEPDFVTGIERENLWQVKFYEGMRKLDKAQMVCFPVLHKQVLEAFPGRTRFVYRNYSYYALFQTIAPKGILRCGGSAGHLAFKLAYYMGFTDIGLIGLDACYEPDPSGQQLYRTHAKGLAYPEWANYHTLKELEQDRKHYGILDCVNLGGQKTMTCVTYSQWAQEISEELLELPYMPVALSLKALPIPGVKYVPIEAWLASGELSKPIFDYPEPEIRSGLKSAKNILAQEVDGFLRQIPALRNLLDTITTGEDLQDLHVYWYHVFYCEPIFVSWVVQCAAKETFQIENLWYSLPSDLALELEKRKKLLRKKLDLAEIVLIKLRNILLFGSLTSEMYPVTVEKI